MDVKIFIDGKYVLDDGILDIKDKGLMVSFPTLVRLFGGKIIGKDNERFVLEKWGKEVVIKANYKTIQIDRKEILMPIDTLERDDLTFVPLKYLCEQIGVIVEVDKKTRTLILNTPDGRNSLLLKVYIKEKDKLIFMNLEEYVKGVAAAEIPYGFHKEAIKALTIVFRTIAMRKIRKLGGYGCKTVDDADICTDRNCCQGWGPKRKHDDKHIIEKACKETEDQIMVFNNSPIYAAYHLTCGGSTENSESIWGNVVSYLRKVECNYCRHSPFYKGERELSFSQLRNKFDLFPGNNFIKDILVSGFIDNIERTSGGRVKSIKAGGKILEGGKLLEFFNLPSTRFWLDIEKLRLLVTGSGHGVGLCKYGADGMAREGKRVEDILNHYYTGIKLEEVKDYSFERPIKGKTITIDCSCKDDLVDYGICENLTRFLTDEGATVILTEQGDDKSIPLSKKVGIANKSNSALFISIRIKNKSDSGTEIFYYPGDKNGKRLAEYVGDRLSYHIKEIKHIIEPGDFYLLRETIMASILIEVYFTEKSGDKDLPYDENRPIKLAKAILESILKYYRV